uniref:Uncharacterized protein n=1 Tax=Arundo donax TaxID=35708 RepID=A0A0A9AD03_ARUDO
MLQSCRVTRSRIQYSSAI